MLEGTCSTPHMLQPHLLRQALVSMVDIAAGAVGY
jgi:hypothetical protein